MTPSLHEVIENIIEEATRDICSVSVSAAQKSKVREILLYSHLSLLEAVYEWAEGMKDHHEMMEIRSGEYTEGFEKALLDFGFLLEDEIKKLK